ncbi:MAG: hypothetical protein PUB43_02075 [Oscillospiraceae bacterium]|nr:hypothetical protein [Oscillospiraceae bacterium]
MYLFELGFEYGFEIGYDDFWVGIKPVIESDSLYKFYLCKGDGLSFQYLFTEKCDSHYDMYNKVPNFEELFDIIDNWDSII